MEPFEESLAFAPSDTFAPTSDEFSIYTHAPKSRLFVLVLLLSYTVIFALFTGFVREKLKEPDSLPQVFLIMGDPQITSLIYYLVCGSAWLLALAVLVYFLYSVIDIWGLEVWVSPRQIRVINTITGQHFKRLTGVGTLDMEEIEELRPAPMATRIFGPSSQLRFSPVDRVEQLIQTIVVHAKNAKIAD